MRGFFRHGCGGNPCLPYAFGFLYSLLAVLTTIQLVRIHWIAQNHRWSMQKGFQFMHIFFCCCRAIFLFSYDALHKTSASGLRTVFVDFPSLVFFTAYTLLVLTWADIVHESMNLKDKCLPLNLFVVVNLAGYVSAALFWSLCAEERTVGIGRRASGVLIAVLDLLAAFVFPIYGNQLLTLLGDPTIRAPLLISKKRQVSWVTFISIMMFSAKSLIETFSLVFETDLAYRDDGVLNVIFYGVTEVIAMSVILWLMSGVPETYSPSTYQTFSLSDDSVSSSYESLDDYRTDSSYSLYFCPAGGSSEIT
eukprot:g4216.t1